MTLNDNHNARVEAAQLKIWALAPDEFTAYYTFPCYFAGERYPREFFPPTLGARVTLWTGKEIGVITYAYVYSHNFGARMVHVRVKGNNGRMYHGRASWNRDVIHLRRMNGYRALGKTRSKP